MKLYALVIFLLSQTVRSQPFGIAYTNLNSIAGDSNVVYRVDFEKMTNDVLAVTGEAYGPRLADLEGKTNEWNSAFTWGSHLAQGYLKTNSLPSFVLTNGADAVLDKLQARYYTTIPDAILVTDGTGSTSGAWGAFTNVSVTAFNAAGWMWSASDSGRLLHTSLSYYDQGDIPGDWIGYGPSAPGIVHVVPYVITNELTNTIVSAGFIHGQHMLPKSILVSAIEDGAFAEADTIQTVISRGYAFTNENGLSVFSTRATEGGPTGKIGIKVNAAKGIEINSDDYGVSVAAAGTAFSSSGGLYGANLEGSISGINAGTIDSQYGGQLLGVIGLFVGSATYFSDPAQAIAIQTLGGIQADGKVSATSFETADGALPSMSQLANAAIKGTNYTDSQISSLANRVQSRSFILTNPTTGGASPLWRLANGITIVNVHVLCVGGTSITGNFWEYDENGANGSTVDGDITATAGTTTDDDGTLSNPSIAAGNYLGWKTTSVNGIVSRAIITVDYR